MTKIKKMPTNRIRPITGGKDPARLVEEFIIRRGFNPEECLQKRTSNFITWSLPIGEGEELEVSLEGLQILESATIYLGINVFEVPIRDSVNYLAAALIVADTLIGAKLSLVNYDIVLSITKYADGISGEELDECYELISLQKTSIRDAIIDEAT